MFVKTLNAGQICLSPDYVFLKRGFEDKFINELKNVFADFYPDGNEDDYTSMVNDHHFNRMRSYIEDAKLKGAEVISLGDFDSEPKDTMTTKVLMNVDDSMQVMQDEIFGPLLPIMLYDELSEVVEYINAHDHPLGLYFFGNKKSEQDFVINNTRSGGVTINDTMFHLMQSHLPFGGVGPSGYGYYFGYEGFLNFSNLRGIYYQTKSDAVLSVMRPPRGKAFGYLLEDNEEAQLNTFLSKISFRYLFQKGSKKAIFFNYSYNIRYWNWNCCINCRAFYNEWFRE